MNGREGEGRGRRGLGEEEKIKHREEAGEREGRKNCREKERQEASREGRQETETNAS